MPYDPYPIVGSHAPEAIEFGREVIDGIPRGRMRYGGGNHCLIFGKSGTGKDTRLLIPNLLRMHGKRSIVCVDPKGEMAACTAHQRAKFGRVLYRQSVRRAQHGVSGFRLYGWLRLQPVVRSQSLVA